MNYPLTIEYLYGLQKHGMKFGLDNISKLMSLFDHPERSFRSVHVAGTNGKGSTAAMIESILRTSGVKTGLFTSPHLLNFTERIRINGKEIDEAVVIRLADEVKKAAESQDDFSPTFFEVVSAMAFNYFRESKVDWAVIETGLGGRLDATNIITPEVSVITGIALDHCEFLGSTISEITREKAGIIKPGVPVVTAVKDAAAKDVIAQKAVDLRSPVFSFDEDFYSELISYDQGEISFTYRCGKRDRKIRLPLLGIHQAVNASLAIRTVEILKEKFPALSVDIDEGLREVRWPGRLEMASIDPPILIDGAHNPDAARALSTHLKRLLKDQYKRVILVLGIMGDKDITGIMAPLLPVSSEIIMASPSYGRAASPDALSACAASKGHASYTAKSVAHAIDLAEDMSRPGDIIVVTGSFYTIGEAKEALGSKGVLARLRE